MEHMQLKRLERKSAIAAKVYVTMLNNLFFKTLAKYKNPI